MFLLASVILSTREGVSVRGISVRDLPRQKPHQTETPRQRPPGHRPPSNSSLDRDPHLYSKERVVCILLECILVYRVFTLRIYSRHSNHLHGHYYSQCYSVHKDLNNASSNKVHSLLGKPI